MKVRIEYAVVALLIAASWAMLLYGAVRWLISAARQ
jgi:hypothetical protein